MRMGFAIKKPLTNQEDLERLSGGITYLINSLGIQGRIECKDLGEDVEFVFDTKDLFDYNEDGIKRNYVTKSK